MPLTKLIESLSNRRAYPHAPKEVTVVQTHISVVFIADELVFKIKKPVDFGFLDFTTLEKRKFFCEEEVRLNARLCPDIYLGVVPITDEGGLFSVEGTGEVVEYAVKMKRLPKGTMMDDLLGAGKVTRKDIGRIAGVLVPFYRSAKTGPEVDRYGTIPVIGLNCDENFNQTRPFIGRTISPANFETIRNFVERTFRTKADLLEGRIRDGFIREGHGDLHSRNISIGKKDIFIYDCIEFNERFRMGDTAQDIAFLVMDLDFFGYPSLSRFFIEQYVRLSGDEGLPGLIDFYACYHAFTRGKVMSFELGEEEIDGDEKEAAAARARAYFHLSHHYAVRQTSPFLVITFGLSGTGKSRIADFLAEEMDFRIIRSDEVRKELTHIGPEEHRYGGYEEGIYSRRMSELTYDTLIDRAGKSLSEGRSVILDACFLRQRDRLRAHELAVQTGSRFLIVAVAAPDAVVKQRIEGRLKQDSVSDGTYEVYLKQKLLYERLTADEHERAVGIDTTNQEQDNAQTVIKRLFLG